MVGKYKGHAPGSDTQAPKQEEDFRHAEEAHYVFHNQTLVQQLREKLAHDDRVAALAEGTGIDDAKLLNALAAHGLDSESVEVLHIVPLLAVAWADGEIQAEEAALLREAADKHPLNDSARAHFKAFLEAPPRPELVDTAVDFIGALLEAADDETAEHEVTSLTDMAMKVADAAGGIFGIFAKVDSDEKAVLARLAEKLGRDHPEAAAALLARL